MRMAGRIGQDPLYKTMGQFSTSLMMFLHNLDFTFDLNILSDLSAEHNRFVKFIFVFDVFWNSPVKAQRYAGKIVSERGSCRKTAVKRCSLIFSYFFSVPLSLFFKSAFLNKKKAISYLRWPFYMVNVFFLHHSWHSSAHATWHSWSSCIVSFFFNQNTLRCE